MVTLDKGCRRWAATMRMKLAALGMSLLIASCGGSGSETATENSETTPENSQTTTEPNPSDERQAGPDLKTMTCGYYQTMFDREKVTVSEDLLAAGGYELHDESIVYVANEVQGHCQTGFRWTVGETWAEGVEEMCVVLRKCRTSV